MWMKFGRVYPKSSTTSNIASRYLHVWMNRKKVRSYRASTTQHCSFASESLTSYAVTNNQFITNCRSFLDSTQSTLNTQHRGPHWHFKDPTNSVRMASLLSVNGNTYRALRSIAQRNRIRLYTVWYKNTAGTHQRTNAIYSAGRPSNEQPTSVQVYWMKCTLADWGYRGEEDRGREER
jgi:hypothetical protein